MRAIEIGEELQYYAGLGKWLSDLAGLYLSQDRLDEAARYARYAVEIKETLDLSAEPWTTYAILAEIAEAQGRADEAAEWRRKEQESYAVYAGAAHYQPLIQAIVAACQGSEEAQSQLEPVLRRIEDTDQVNRRFAQAARRILAGERDAEMLLADLGRIGATTVRAILSQLSGEAPVPSAAQASSAPRLGAGAQAQQITLDDLLGLVAQACTPAAPPGLGEQLYGLTRTVSTDPNALPEVRALGRALNAVLSGERDPDLSALPPELAAGVRRMLARLK